MKSFITDNNKGYVLVANSDLSVATKNKIYHFNDRGCLNVVLTVMIDSSEPKELEEFKGLVKSLVEKGYTVSSHKLEELEGTLAEKISGLQGKPAANPPLKYYQDCQEIVENIRVARYTSKHFQDVYVDNCKIIASNVEDIYKKAEKGGERGAVEAKLKQDIKTLYENIIDTVMYGQSPDIIAQVKSAVDTTPLLSARTEIDKLMENLDKKYSQTPTWKIVLRICTLCISYAIEKAIEHLKDDPIRKDLENIYKTLGKTIQKEVIKATWGDKVEASKTTSDQLNK